MANAGQIRAGRAYVELGVKDTIGAGLAKALTRLRAFSSSVKRIGSELTAIGRSTTLVGAAMSAPFLLATRTMAGFEKQMSRVAALTGATGGDFENLRNEARKLGAETVFTASQAAEAMSFFALAGFKVDEILKSLRPTLNLAAAGQLEIAEAADIAAKIMAGMGIQADDLGGAVDVLASAFTTANTDLRQLGDAMKFVGPVAKTAGIGIEDITAAVQLLSNKGIQAEMAGTTLRGVILSLTSPSKEAADVLASLGVATNDAAGNFRPLADIVDDLNKSIDGVGSGKRLEIIGKIFDARQAAGFAAIMDEGGDALRRLSDSLRDSTGTAARIAGIQLDNLAGDATILKSAMEELQISVGNALDAPLRRMAQSVTRIVGRMSQWAKENRTLIVGLAAAVASITALGVGLIGTGLAFKALGFATGIIAGALSLAKVAIAALISPIGLVSAAAIAGAAAVLYYSGAWKDVSGFLKGVFVDLSDTARKTFAGIADALATGDILTAARILWLGLKAAWLTGIEPLTTAWSKFRESFVQTAGAAFYGALELWENVSNSLEKAWIESAAFFERTWTNATSFIGGVWDGFVNGIKDAWSESERFLLKSWNSIKGAFDDTFNVEAENRNVDKGVDDKKSSRVQEELARATKREEDRQKALAAAEQKRTSRRAAAEQEHKDALKRISDAEIALSEAASRNATEDIAKAAAELEAAKNELDVARQKAADERKRQREEREERNHKRNDDPGRYDGDPPEGREGVAPPPDGGAGGESIVQQSGGQNAEFTLGGAGLTAQQKTAQNTERTAKAVESFTSRMNDAARNRERGMGSDPVSKPPIVKRDMKPEQMSRAELEAAVAKAEELAGILARNSPGRSGIGDQNQRDLIQKNLERLKNLREALRHRYDREAEKGATTQPTDFFSDRVTGMADRLAAVVPTALSGLAASMGGPVATTTGGGDDELVKLQRQLVTLTQQVVANTRDGGAAYS